MRVIKGYYDTQPKTLLVQQSQKEKRWALKKNRGSYLGSPGTGSTYEAECVEKEIGGGAEAEELGEWDGGEFQRGLNGGRSGSGIVELLFVGDGLGFPEGEPVPLGYLEVMLLVRYRGCSRHSWR